MPSASLGMTSSSFEFLVFSFELKRFPLRLKPDSVQSVQGPDFQGPDIR